MYNRYYKTDFIPLLFLYSRSIPAGLDFSKKEDDFSSSL